jgi:hypothetical protein
MLLPRYLLPSDTCFPTTLAPRIVEGVGVSVREDEGVDEGEGEGESGEETYGEFWF